MISLVRHRFDLPGRFLMILIFLGGHSAYGAPQVRLPSLSGTPLHWEVYLLQTGFSERCNHYFGALTPAAHLCSDLSREMARAMVPTYDSDGGFIVYGAEMENLLTQRKVLLYLRSLSRSELRSQNLFSWTLSFTENDFQTALKWVALLFEDTTEQSRQIKYLRNHDQGKWGPALNALEAADRAIRDGDFSLYPEDFPSTTHRSLYHFYLPAYATQRLSRNHPDLKSWAAVAPFLMNLNYEILFHYCARETIPGCLDAGYVPLEPNRDWIEDAYWGYAGSLWGADAPALSWDQFEPVFTEDIPRFVMEAWPLADDP